MKSVETLDFKCRGVPGRINSRWNLDNVTTINGSLDDCMGSFNIFNSTYVEMNVNQWDAIDVEITTDGNNDELILNCYGDDTCDESIYLCIKGDDMLQLNCCGEDFCQGIQFCSETQSFPVPSKTGCNPFTTTTMIATQIDETMSTVKIHNNETHSSNTSSIELERHCSVIFIILCCLYFAIS